MDTGEGGRRFSENGEGAGTGVRQERLRFQYFMYCFIEPAGRFSGGLAEGEARSAGQLPPSVVPGHVGLVFEGFRVPVGAILVNIVRKAGEGDAGKRLADEPFDILDKHDLPR